MEGKVGGGLYVFWGFGLGGGLGRRNERRE